MLPYSGKEVPVLLALVTLPLEPGAGMRKCPYKGGDPVLSMQLSVSQVGVTLMLYPVSKLETLPSDCPCCGLGFSVDRKELKVLATVLLA